MTRRTPSLEAVLRVESLEERAVPSQGWKPVVAPTDVVQTQNTDNTEKTDEYNTADTPTATSTAPDGTSVAPTTTSKGGESSTSSETKGGSYVLKETKPYSTANDATAVHPTATNSNSGTTDTMPGDGTTTAGET